MAYTLFDNYTDTCLEDGMRKGLPCFKVYHELLKKKNKIRYYAYYCHSTNFSKFDR